MKKLELTLTDPVQYRLEIASQRAAKPVDQFVQDLLAKISEEMAGEPGASEALLSEGYQVMSNDNAETIKIALAAQLTALEKSGGFSHGSDSTR
ncbi:hypothetical protein DCC62_21175 [candidate division KSB1 bacterium]|nr:MAG: hypothetical protein DCC62_21175 [candidate division KSB1 bacterium]